MIGDASTRFVGPWIGRNTDRGGTLLGAVVPRYERPVVSLVTFGALLLALAVSGLRAKLGAAGKHAAAPDSVVEEGFEALARDFPQQRSSPALIAVVGNVRSRS